ncbi:hypothetical protein EJ110_NYTH17194 [Nymphaea thermarum]|nr:hypothetical protein EJ110_NYTH17194 [Nymphaea thermarum]
MRERCGAFYFRAIEDFSSGSELATTVTSINAKFVERLSFGVGWVAAECLDLLRMDQQTYALLCNLLKSRELLCDAREITIEEQVTMFLVILGHDQQNRQTQYDFQHSGQTITKYFNLVLKAIFHVAHEYVGPTSHRYGRLGRVPTSTRRHGDPDTGIRLDTFWIGAFHLIHRILSPSTRTLNPQRRGKT